MSIHRIQPMGLQTERLILRQATRHDATALLDYYLVNRGHLQPWEPLRSGDFYTVAALERRLEGMEQQMRADSALHLLMFRRNANELLGECNFTNMVRGPFRACHLGFSIAAAAQGRDLMHEGLSVAIAFVFDVYGLHRVMANYRPENVRSGRLLERLGFETEGKARAYLKINGEWADHILTSRINESR